MRHLLRALIIASGLILLWQAILTYWQIPDYLLPSPWQVATTLGQQYPVLANQTLPTLLEILLGFTLGIGCGCLAGFSITFFRPLAFWFLPLIIISQAIPTFAIAPLLVMWLGYGIASKIAITVLMIFFPVASALHDGLRRTNPHWLDLAKTMNASRWRIFWHIRLPAALPSLGSGIRIAAVTAPIGAIVGEWVGASQGLGYVMLNANAHMQIDMMFAALLVIIAMALILYFSVDTALKKIIRWEG